MAETIAAISTAPGEGGIGIVRVSGPASLDVMHKTMQHCPETPEARHAYFGKIIGTSGEIIDEGIFLYMKGPNSYTGEDMLEIQAHGSNVSLKEILRSVLNGGYDGMRMAEPGEYTKLAFLNGKMDLSQAEAVIDIIKAKTDMSLEIAERQRDGRLSAAIEDIRQNLLDILAHMAVDIDYPDEDIEDTENSEVANELRYVLNDIDELLDTASIGRIAREGIHIAIVGKPNVGKSSLMNALLGEGRVIVTDIPGTTRDTVEESATLGGIPIVLVDTAGLRETTDQVEKIGIERTERAIAAADMVILVIDGSKDLDPTDDEILKFITEMNGERILVVINKTDLGEVVSESDVHNLIDGCSVVTTSLLGKNAIDAAKAVTAAITEMFELGSINTKESNIITNERHVKLLRSASHNLGEAISLLENGEPFEVVELSTHYAFNELGYIIGEEVGDDVIDAVFSKFCLGK